MAITVKPQRLEISLIAEDKKIVEIVGIRRPYRDNERGIFPKAVSIDERKKYTDQGVSIEGVFDVISTSGELTLSDTTMNSSFSEIYDVLTNIAIGRGYKDDYRITTEIKPTDESQ